MYNFANNYTRWKGMIDGFVEAGGQVVTTGSSDIDVYDVGAAVASGYIKNKWLAFGIGASGWFIDSKTSQIQQGKYLNKAKFMDYSIDTFTGINELVMSSLSGHFLGKSVGNSTAGKVLMQVHDGLYDWGYKALGERMKKKGW
ncbi:hypothetical protein EI427_17325 [Flammeovirga pectinis]|uniref:Uncharacterized protein n=1 Tax=Flammeovirga pectinis TaxID=2494373 RepID=A0A3Q9FQ97_9BACT|nr:hypothetical protein [Flammeovirga pectinis]AZQ63922.1 hypothetical protein EI427_17325 [Flammeovirga pectinis]